MNASRSFATALSSASGITLDGSVATLAGLSVAFAAFAIPSDLLNELVGSSGLASLFAAVEPPLGVKTRIIIGAAGSVAMFATVLLLLRWLDRLGSHPIEAEPKWGPRLRRRDSHPDAPPRVPLFAARELAEPDFAEPPVVRRPTWLPDAVKAEPAAVEPVRAEIRAHPASLNELMVRLEQGLAPRRVTPAASTRAPATAPQAYSEPVDDRLQSAIENLQRLASRRA